MQLSRVTSSIRFWFRAFIERAAVWIADHLPRRIAFYAAVRVGSEACVGTPMKYGTKIAGQITVVEALQRWESANG